jgi:AAA+ ATPase superfamily predicted ATPase
MRFYDRERELARLDEIASLSRRASHLAVVTGRRRVGKQEAFGSLRIIPNEPIIGIK